MEELSRRTWATLAAALAYVRGDDIAERQAIVFGFVGEGVRIEFRTWCQHADLLDSVDVIADPVDLNQHLGRVWTVVSGIVTSAAAQGIKMPGGSCGGGCWPSQQVPIDASSPSHRQSELMQETSRVDVTIPRVERENS